MLCRLLAAGSLKPPGQEEVPRTTRETPTEPCTTREAPTEPCTTREYPEPYLPPWPGDGTGAPEVSFKKHAPL